jgi:hypothetical protein
MPQTVDIFLSFINYYWSNIYKTKSSSLATKFFSYFTPPNIIIWSLYIVAVKLDRGLNNWEFFGFIYYQIPFYKS